MDLALYARVLWRFRILVLLGAAFGIVLASLSFVRVDFDGGAPRLTPPETTWQSDATLFVTEEGFPWGRSVLEASPTETGESPRFSDPGRFSGLASLYARLAVSDEMHEILQREGPLEGTYRAVQARSEDGTYLPLVVIIGYSDSAEGAVLLSNRVATAFQSFLRRLQIENGIPASDRVQVPLVNQAMVATVFDSPSVVKPLFVLLLVLSATIGLAFVLENLRPRQLSDAGEPDVPAPAREPYRRSA
jgi:hypothetical protein